MTPKEFMQLFYSSEYGLMNLKDEDSAKKMVEYAMKHQEAMKKVGVATPEDEAKRAQKLLEDQLKKKREAMHKPPTTREAFYESLKSGIMPATSPTTSTFSHSPSPGSYASWTGTAVSAPQTEDVDIMEKFKNMSFELNSITETRGRLKAGMLVFTNGDMSGMTENIIAGKVAFVTSEGFTISASKIHEDEMIFMRQNWRKLLHMTGRSFLGSESIHFPDSWTVEWKSRGNILYQSNAMECKKVETFDPKDGIDVYIDKILATSTDEDRKKSLNTYKRCVLPVRVKKMIEEALVMVLRKNIFEEWGFNETFEKGLTNSIMLYGPPGTGKTMICETIASVLGKDLLKLDSGVLQSQIPGQVERNITDNFNQAKEQDAVILLDECDSLLYNRDAVGSIMSAEINHLLKEIENFDGVCLLTTNRLGKLDPALQRRIIAKIELPLPTREARAQIWQNLIPKKMPTGDVDYQALAEYEISGGEIKNAVILAARKAVLSGAERVEHKHLLSGAKSVARAKMQFDDVKTNFSSLPEGFHGYTKTCTQ